MKALFTLLLTLTLFTTACTSTPPPEHLRMGLETAPAMLDPRFATDAASARVNRLLFERLVDFDTQQRPRPSLATWELLSPTRYRFQLVDTLADNPNARLFSNGQRLTAQDVKATYDFILEPRNASPHRGSLQGIQNISVENENTVIFDLKQADLLFPARLVIGIIPAQVAANFNQAPIGSGALQFARWQNPTQLVLQRRIDKQLIEFIEVKDPVVRVLKLLRAEVDILQNDLPPELVAWLAQKNEVLVLRKAGADFSYLGFNLQDVATGKLAVRQAIAKGIQRQDLIHYVLGDAAQEANALLPPHHWAGNPNLTRYEYQPEQARQLLASAGYTAENPLILNYKTSTNPVRVRLATVIQHQLQAIGIQVQLRTYDWGTFYADIKAGRFQMFSLAWVGIKNPDIFRYALHSQSIPPNGANRGRWQDNTTDSLIEQAEHADTLEKQAEFYRQLQAHLLEQLPYVPLWYENQVLVTRKAVQGYVMSNDGNFDGLKQAWLQK